MSVEINDAFWAVEFLCYMVCKIEIAQLNLAAIGIYTINIAMFIEFKLGESWGG